MLRREFWHRSVVRKGFDVTPKVRNRGLLNRAVTWSKLCPSLGVRTAQVFYRFLCPGFGRSRTVAGRATFLTPVKIQQLVRTSRRIPF
jgi:hypothetical protein